jgi:hypothetical protein
VGDAGAVDGPVTGELPPTALEDTVVRPGVFHIVHTAIIMMS